MSRQMNSKQIAEMTKWKLLGKTSCADCQYLYMQDSGYNNYTVEETSVLCALDRNPHLETGPLLPYNWNYDGDTDNWPCTNKSRCEMYLHSPTGAHVHLDVDGEASPKNWADELEPEAIRAIQKHGRRE